jgi:1,4-alpha-glucan branching enzyme
MSVLDLPPRPENYHPINGLPEGLKFSFRGPPGEIVTVAGNFNGWDPFMYELKESSAGFYSLTIPLPPGTYQYVFFHRGQRYADPYNPRRVYSRDGSAASEIVIP